MQEDDSGVYCSKNNNKQLLDKSINCIKGIYIYKYILKLWERTSTNTCIGVWHSTEMALSQYYQWSLYSAAKF